MISNFKTILFLVLILAISSKAFKKQMNGSQPAPAEEQHRPDIMEVALKEFLSNAKLDIEDFIRGATGFCRDLQIPEPSRQELEDIFHQVDADHDGKMSGEEFRDLIEYVKNENERNGQASFVQKVPFRSWIQKRLATWVQKNQKKSKKTYWLKW